MTFIENERKSFEKCKELINQTFRMSNYDSGEKILNAGVIYYFYKLYDAKPKKKNIKK